jgi:hypothetical protein
MPGRITLSKSEVLKKTANPPEKGSLDRLPPDRLRLVGERIDDLARHLELSRSDRLRSLYFKKLEGNPCPPSTHELDAKQTRMPHGSTALRGRTIRSGSARQAPLPDEPGYLCLCPWRIGLQLGS